MLDFLKPKKKTNHKVWKVVGGVALAALAAGLIVSFPDIKRYIKMSSM
jgi:hypothetical protein